MKHKSSMAGYSWVKHMIVSNALFRTKAASQLLANQLGCTVSEVVLSLSFNQSVVFDVKGIVAERLKAAGARWALSGKALTFPSWSRLESVLAAILKEVG
ncbi:hypothetical protein [Variovorax boronicumulans]|uniref:hypothetical protein n=1 Tax=Variovorax boronicumulans TaxID=436515 RepID=UPI0027D86F5D|nr:hypothetical protein [Variovorax boronicumulans]